MSGLDTDIATLRRRRHAPSFMARLRRLSLFERRAIRDPDERDSYWMRVHERLVQSDAASLTRHAPREAAEPPRRTTVLID